MKSTQDLIIFLNCLEQALEIPTSGKVLSIEIFADKTFRINEQKGDISTTIYDSEEVMLDSGLADFDINDLCYKDPDYFAEEVKEARQEKKNELDLT